MSEAPPPVPSSGAAGSTQSAGQSIDEGKGRIFPCEGCGADLEFNIGQQRLKCPFCGFEKDLDIPAEAEIVEQDFAAMLERLKELRQSQQEPTTSGDSDAKEVRCESCGGNVQFLGSLTSSECPYCGSPIQRDKVHDAPDRVHVDAVLPFLVDEPTGHDAMGEWLGRLWFAPSGLADYADRKSVV